MYHPLSRDWLYTSNQIEVVFDNSPEILHFYKKSH